MAPHNKSGWRIREASISFAWGVISIHTAFRWECGTGLINNSRSCPDLFSMICFCPLIKTKSHKLPSAVTIRAMQRLALLHDKLLVRLHYRNSIVFDCCLTGRVLDV